jgi:hypothetical protein
MKPDEVRALLGEPEHVEGGRIARWFWGNFAPAGAGPNVTFQDGKVYSWSEPRQ